jgi:hypothetical protein
MPALAYQYMKGTQQRPVDIIEESALRREYG